MKKVFLVFSLVLFFFQLFAQTKILSHDNYDTWNDIKDFILSPNGNYAIWQQNPQKGDGKLIVAETESGKQIAEFNRAQNAVFCPNSEFLVFKVVCQADTIRNLKIKKKKEDTFPKDSLFIYSFNSDTIYKAARVKSFKIGKDKNSVLAYLHENDDEEKKKDKDKNETEIQDSLKQEDSNPKPKIIGSKLVLGNLKTKLFAEFENVIDYDLADNGSFLIYTSEIKDSTDSVAIFIVNSSTMSKRQVSFDAGYAKGLSIDKIGEKFAFYFSTDTAKQKDWTIFIYDTENLKRLQLNNESVVNIPKNWKISENHKLKFSDDATRLYFGTSFYRKEISNDSTPDDEIAKLDIWSWTDNKLMSAQLKSLDKDKKKTFDAVYNFEFKQAIQLSDSISGEVVLSRKANNEIVLAVNRFPYEYLSQWDTDSKSDYYFVNLQTGKKTLLAKDFSGSVYLSPDTKFAAIYDRNDSVWYLNDLRRQISYPITDKITHIFANEEHDMPSLPSHYGIVGWMKNDRALVIYDKYDLWMINTGKDGDIINLTKEYGRKNDVVLRYIKTNPDADYLDENDILLLSGFNKKTKSHAVYSLNLKNQELNLLIGVDARISHVEKAKDAEIFTYSLGDYRTYPDRYSVKDLSDWNKKQKLTDINPQTCDYSWGNVELYNWISFNGDSLQGLLYTPEDYDKTKTYPVIVYFYEKYSDHLHTHYTPRPSRSVINFPYYVSNDYVLFIPDIPYTIAQPGKDAFNAVVSGTYSLIERGIADKNRIALQGQSWGGYQVAHIITQTDLYKCAMAGAPVSNMTSAYGGIRWESGNSRMMQYEGGQSRIGDNIWNNLPAYIENSPIFFADKIKTPLLIMHNDADGAVPWTQGIELFVALKRLNKPCWLINYNGDEHNLKNRANTIDLSKRMSEFFDYYLKQNDCPRWMQNGVPALNKGEW